MSGARVDHFRCQLEKALENENFKDCRLEFSTEGGPNGGFLSDTYLAKLTATNNKNERQTIEVFIKTEKDGSAFNGTYNFDDVYIREVYMYSTVFPALSTFLREKNASYGLDFIPKCFGSFILPDTAAVVLENLNVQRYELHDHMYPLNLNHIKLVFGNLAKLHATSFALKDQKPDEYDRITQSLTWLAEDYWGKENNRPRYEIHNEKLCKMLIEAGHKELVERWREYIKQGSFNILTAIKSFQVHETCILHADCWNNNILFKYMDNNQTPSEAKLVDFQLCQRNSPVLDLCNLFYFTCGTESESHFDELLGHYYQIFSNCLKELGSDPDKMFPLQTLKKHWRECSIYTALKAWHAIHCISCDMDDVVKYEDLEDKTSFLFQEFKIKHMDMYISRIVAIIKHFCDYQDKYDEQ